MGVSPSSDILLIMAQLEQGMTVRLRQRVWSVADVRRTSRNGDSIHRLELECLSDNGLGKRISVIWEREISPSVIEGAELPSPDGLDEPELLEAFISAVRWSSASVAEGSAMQAPFRGAVEIESTSSSRSSALSRCRG